jgi:multiple sugar transport system ATP-binding protein
MYIELKNINKIYPNGFHAVHNFCLEIEKGEFVVFVGPSGCGKSTTLRMIAGLENISSGEFLINGERANEKSPGSGKLRWYSRAMRCIRR